MSHSTTPNLVVIFADDLGAWALGCAGNDDAHTPAIDAIAAQGVRFENFFCVSPVCSPARASLLTGKIPSQHGVHDWVRSGNSGTDRIDYLEGQHALHDALAAAGYRCAMIGKWHLGASDSPREAFEHWFAHEKGGGSYYGATMFRGEVRETVPGYLTDAIAEDAVRFIDSVAESDQPFYLNVSFTAPHHPWVDSHPQELLDIFVDSAFDSCPREEAHPWLLMENPETVAASDDPEGSRLGYFAAVAGLDRAVGTILAHLQSRGLNRDTVIAFVGDNGFNAGHHGIWGKGNGTFPQNMFDTSVKVPAILSQPGRIREGVVSPSLLSGYDLMPTLLELLEVPFVPDTTLPGQSFADLLLHKDPTDPPRHVVVFDEYGPVRMIRTSEWKYVHRVGGPDELYDLTADPHERLNLINQAEHKEQRLQLCAELEEWFSRYVDPYVDGARFPVTGLGQTSRANPKAFTQLSGERADPNTFVLS